MHEPCGTPADILLVVVVDFNLETAIVQKRLNHFEVFSEMGRPVYMHIWIPGSDR